MFRTLYSKLVITLLALLIPVAAIFVVSTHYSSQRYQQEVAQKLNRELAAHIASEWQLVRGGQFDSKALETLFHTLMVINPSIELYGLDRTGVVRAFSAPPGHLKRRQISLTPVNAYLKGDFSIPLLGDDPRSYDREKVFSAAPLFENNELAGYLYIVLASETYDGVAAMLRDSHSFRQAASMTTAAVIFALVAGLLLMAWLTRKLRRLNSDMSSFAATNFTNYPDKNHAQLPLEGDELDRLRHTFHAMARRISDQLESLRRTDATRREMIANVSHDLRTPLASLSGYLETLLIKGDNLSPQEQRSFIEIAAKHSRHLGKLIEELFELAKLDSLETLLHCEPVSLAELLQDVTQKFSLAAQQKNIQLECRCERNLPFVAADIGLIVRALENLIENALRYTPAGGKISVEVTRDTGQISVRVADTGCGIAEDELPRVFERFYRLEKSRTEDGGAGLGLAIVKRIVELHGSTIQAVSKPNAGTAFSFRLPVAAA